MIVLGFFLPWMGRTPFPLGGQLEGLWVTGYNIPIMATRLAELGAEWTGRPPDIDYALYGLYFIPLFCLAIGVLAAFGHTETDKPLGTDRASTAGYFKVTVHETLVAHLRQPLYEVADHLKITWPTSKDISRFSDRQSNFFRSSLLPPE